METKIKIPTTATLEAVETEKVQTILTFHRPQIVGHLAFIPIESRIANADVLKTIGLIEEFQLEQDIIVSDSGDYSKADYVNNTDKNVIVPPATHLKGGHQNRGNNQTEILQPDRSKRVNVNCFEPSRGSGANRFTEFDDTPADVAKVTMNKTDNYSGSWGVIGDYTSLIKQSHDFLSSRGALSNFNDRTKKERASHALNFETVKGQTGCAIITRYLSMVEIFPTPNVFNIYRNRLLRGKVASLYYRLSKTEKRLLLPSDIKTQLDNMMQIIKTSIEQTAEKAAEKGTSDSGLLIGRIRKDESIDVILSKESETQLAYLFGAW